MKCIWWGNSSLSTFSASELSILKLYASDTQTCVWNMTDFQVSQTIGI